MAHHVDQARGMLDGMKNKHAQNLGRIGGLKGGLARAKALSPERRSEIARTAAESRWAKTRIPQEVPTEWSISDAGQITEDPNRPKRHCGNRMCFCDGSCMIAQREYDLRRELGESSAPQESGMEDIPKGHWRSCSDPNHIPGPMLLYIPPGKRYRHVCPLCGNVTYIYGSDIRF